MRSRWGPNGCLSPQRDALVLAEGEVPAQYISRMPTYVYETISPTPEGFEVRQGFDDPALTTHPHPGEPARRVISGGLALVPSATSADEGPEPGCGPATCQCGRFS